MVVSNPEITEANSHPGEVSIGECHTLIKVFNTDLIDTDTENNYNIFKSQQTSGNFQVIRNSKERDTNKINYIIVTVLCG